MAQIISPLMTCSGRALSPVTSINQRGPAEAASSAMIAAGGFFVNHSKAAGTRMAPATASVVRPTASGHARRAIAVIKKRSGLGLGMDAVEEPVFIQI